MKFSEDQIAQIREANNIVDVIGEHVRLRKRGRNYVGLCPFHNEKTPSFSVLEDKGIFKCFGCGKGGDVFSFMMEIETLSFPEAVERLAQRANITIEQSPQEEQQQSHRETLYHAIRAAAGLYYKALKSGSGEEALHYLHQRGFGDEILKKFGIGYASDTPGQIMNALVRQGYPAEILEQVGIVARSSGGEWFERFRGRIMFPVISSTGRVVGFGGRIFGTAQDNKTLAKYINSPDTQIYHKSQILYGLYQGKDAIRKLEYAILVEGYADVLALHQAGFTNVVAASGTSLTPDQLSALKRYTSSIVLLFDADNAGKMAAVRGIELAIEAGFDVKTVVLPAGEDPDSFVRKNGAEAFALALKQKQPFVETKAQWFAEQGALDDPAKASAAIRSIVETIAKVPDAIQRELFIRRLAGRFKILESTLFSELNRITKQGAKAQPAARTSALRTEEVVPQRPKPLVLTKHQRTILEALLSNPTAVAKLIDEHEFDLDLIHSDVIRDIINHTRGAVKFGLAPTVAEILAAFRSNEEYQELIVDSSMSDRNLEPELAPRIAEEAFYQLMIESKDNETKELRKQLQVADDNEKSHHLESIQRLAEEIIGLKSHLRSIR